MLLVLEAHFQVLRGLNVSLLDGQLLTGPIFCSCFLSHIYIYIYIYACLQCGQHYRQSEKTVSVSKMPFQFLVLVAVLFSHSAQAKVLWSSNPVENWSDIIREAYAIGNGRLGGILVFTYFLSHELSIY